MGYRAGFFELSRRTQAGRRLAYLPGTLPLSLQRSLLREAVEDRLLPGRAYFDDSALIDGTALVGTPVQVASRIQNQFANRNTPIDAGKSTKHSLLTARVELEKLEHVPGRRTSPLSEWRVVREQLGYSDPLSRECSRRAGVA